MDRSAENTRRRLENRNHRFPICYPKLDSKLEQAAREWQASMWELQKKMMGFLPGDYQEWWTPRPPLKKDKKEEPVKKCGKCTCGAEAVDSPKHSKWCDTQADDSAAAYEQALTVKVQDVARLYGVPPKYMAFDKSKLWPDEWVSTCCYGLHYWDLKQIKREDIKCPKCGKGVQPS